jgi:hypothetical protein
MKPAHTQRMKLAQPNSGRPRNRLCRAAGRAPGEGVGAATRSARSLGEIAP